MFAKDYRRIARENLQGNWKTSVLTAMVACLLGGLITGSMFFPEFEVELNGENIRNLKDLLTIPLVHGSLAIGGIMGLLHFIVGGVIQLGYAQYLLNQHDRREFQFKDLFSKFDYFGAGFCQAFLRGLYTFLWSLLFVIPGIIASYRYAMTSFIMAEHSEMTASEAIRASKQMMTGHKWELFCLDFSFFGWNLLCGLTMNLGNLFLNPYTNAAHAAFYRKISAHNPNPEL